MKPLCVLPRQVCKGQRLKKEALAVTIADKNIFEMTDMSIRNFAYFISGLKLNDYHIAIGKQILREIQARTSFLINVGLDYMALSRATSTLSEESYSVSVWQLKLAQDW